VPRGSVKCILCRGSINLKSGDLTKFKTHLETVHDSLYDMDLIMCVAFLEGDEIERLRESIVDTVFPRIKNFFKSIKSMDHNAGTKLSIEKRLLEDDDDEVILPRPSKKMRIEEPKTSEELELIDDSISDENLVDQSISVIDVLEENEISDEEISDDSDVEEDSAPLEQGLSHCDLCQLSLPNSSFKSHMELHEEETYKDDSVVNEATLDRDADDLVDNQKTSEVNSESSLGKCDICNKAMQKKSLAKHMRKIHNIYSSRNILEKVNSARSEPPVNDTAVNDNTVDDTDADNEDKDDPSFQSSSTGSSTVRCDICLKTMLKKSLRRHMAKLHVSEKLQANDTSTTSNFDTTVASDEFINNSILAEPAFDSRCKICFRRFDKLQELKNHVKEAHDIDYEDLETIEDSEKKVFKEQAFRKLKTEAMLQESEMEASSLEESCEDDETLDNSLSDTNEKKIQCEQCDVTFKRRDSLTRHNRNVHAKTAGQ